MCVDGRSLRHPPRCYTIVTISVCHETVRHSRILRVFADGLSASAVVQVTVGDVNDNSPFFEPQVYALNVEATVGQGPLLIVQGADLDSGDYGTVSYSFVNDNGNDYFHIDAGSGELAGVRFKLQHVEAL